MTTRSPFQRQPSKTEFPALEMEILGLWSKLGAFAESNRRRSAGKPYVFYDGPPFATGTPHYGHLLAGTIKDIVPRYWNMRGHPVERRFGWDCHGLPIEVLAQQALGLAGSRDILERGVDTFNEQCRSMVLAYVAEWRQTVTRMGRWVDFDNDYKTMDASFMESVWWVFKQLWDRGRVYKSYRVMPYSWKLATPLSNFEANRNYKDVQDPAITLRFGATSGHEGLNASGPVYLLAWTTTPWTLPANLALAVGANIPYVAVRLASQEVYVLARARLDAYSKHLGAHEVVAELDGADLVGWRYEPLFDYFATQSNSFRVLVDDFVTTVDGTGIVHLAPAYGEDDFRVCRAAGIELVDALDAQGCFTRAVTDFAGQLCKDADKSIIGWLKREGKLVHQSTLVHSYPFDERTDTPLIYRAIDAWYVKVADLRERLVELNASVTWVPRAVGDSRFGNWLREANDWNVSRNRYWGSCLPIWINEQDSRDMICVGSIAELEALSGQRLSDLHKHHVDRVVICREGKTYRRTPEVLDCWFESGAMPYAQKHYPFENEAALSAFFPADFIAEGLDQTRGWFYTLLVLGASLFDQSPFRNVVVNGMVLAEDGQKMSKSKRNYPDPNQILDAYGADALRAYLINSPVVRGEPLRFSERGLTEIVRTVVLPFWNALGFFTTYAAIDGFDPRAAAAPAVASRPDIDRWILSVLQSLIGDVNREMEAYRLYNVVPRLVAFIDDLTNWYVRRSRPRFWKSEDDADKACAYHTLYEALVTFATVLAPFMPFLTEAAYQELVRSVAPERPPSIHWCDYPTIQSEFVDPDLERRMATVREVVALGRKLREDHSLKVRQPLHSVTVVHRDPRLRRDVTASSELIGDELNVKQVQVESDEKSFADVRVKPNFKTLGKRCGPKLKQIGLVLATWSFDEVSRLEAGQSIEVAGELLSIEDVLLERTAKQAGAIASNGEITVFLDTQLTAALLQEGLAREFVSQIQAARKAAGFDLADRIELTWACAEQALAEAISQHQATIAREVLATAFQRDTSDTAVDQLQVNGVTVNYRLVKRS